jgi:hypothetical protein
MLTKETQITWREESQCYYIHHKSHNDWLGIQAGSLGERPVSMVTKYVGNENRMYMPHTIILAY